jgi:hypothetical protein
MAGFLSDLLTKYNRIINNGVILPRRSALNVVGATATDDPANDATNLTIVGGSGSSGGATSVTFNFTQPAVNSTVNVSVGTTAGILGGQSIAIGGGGYYINTSTVDATHLLLLNTGAAVNAASAATILAGDVVTVAGQGASLAGQAPANGQTLVLTNGVYTPVGHRQYCNVLSFPGVDPTGNTDSYAGFLAALTFASANNLTLYVPYGTYLLTRHIYMPGPVTVQGDDLAPTINSSFLGAFWGGGFVGEAFVICPATAFFAMQYVHTSGFYLVKIGGSAASGGFPFLFLSESPFASLNGMTALTLEWTFEVTGTIGTDSQFPWCGGRKTNNSPLHEALSVLFSASSGSFDITAVLSVAGGSGTVMCTTGSSGAFAQNTIYSARLTWDGTTLRFAAAAGGGSPTISVSGTGGTGAIVQHPWEDFIMGASSRALGLWPYGSTDEGPPMAWGNFRKSNTARTGNLPSTEFLVGDCDSNTDLLVSFNPAYLTGATGVVGACGHPTDFNVTLGAPCNSLLMFQNVFITTKENGPVCTFKNLNFTPFAGIRAECSQNTNTFDCTFTTRKGITRTNNSYYGKDIRPTFVTQKYQAGNCSHSWGSCRTITSGAGVTDNPLFAGPVQGTAAIILNGSGACMVRDLLINTVNGPFGIVDSNDAQGSQFLNCGIGTESGGGGLDTLAVFNNCNNISWTGGGLFVAAGTAASGCALLIDSGLGHRFNFDMASIPTGVTALVSCPQAPSATIVLEQPYQGQGLENPVPWSDGTAPVMVLPLETNGRTTWNATGSGNITCQWYAAASPTGPDFSCRTIVITDTNSHLTGTTPVVAPTFAAGYERVVVAPPTDAITFGASSGATVTIAAGKRAWVQSNGAGWERVTADV